MKYRKIASKKTEIITEQPERKNHRRKPGFYGRLRVLRTCEDPDGRVTARGVDNRTRYRRARKCAE